MKNRQRKYYFVFFILCATTMLFTKLSADYSPIYVETFTTPALYLWILTMISTICVPKISRPSTKKVHHN